MRRLFPLLHHSSLPHPSSSLSLYHHSLRLFSTALWKTQPHNNNTTTSPSPALSPAPVDHYMSIDHNSFLDEYRVYQSSSTSTSTSPSTTSSHSKQALAKDLLIRIIQHSIAEELVVYPIIEKCNAFERGRSIVERLSSQHSVIRRLSLDLLNSSTINPKEFDKLMTIVKGHVAEEERTQLPEVRKRLTKDHRKQLGVLFLKTKSALTECHFENFANVDVAIDIAKTIIQAAIVVNQK